MGFATRDYARGTSDHHFYVNLQGRGVTFWLITINVVVFVLDALFARMSFSGDPSILTHGMVDFRGPLYQWGHFSVTTALTHLQLWRLLSFQFLHAGLWHLVFNMVGLYVFGRVVESYLGSQRYLAFYLLGGMAGAMLYLLLWMLGGFTGNARIPFLLFTDPDTPLIGASAGIFAVLVGAAMVVPHQRLTFFVLMILPIELTYRTAALLMVGLSLFMLMVGGMNAGGEAGHVGGAAAGFLLIRHDHWLNWALKLPTRWPSWRLRFWHSATTAARQHGGHGLEASIDSILDKVHAHGLQSLSEEERRALARATAKQRRRSR